MGRYRQNLQEEEQSEKFQKVTGLGSNKSDLMLVSAQVLEQYGNIEDNNTLDYGVVDDNFKSNEIVFVPQLRR